MLETDLLPSNSEITEKGDGAAIDISVAANRVFLVVLQITQMVEQESFELTIFGSADGTNWGAKPLLRFPQQFYRGETPRLLDLTTMPDMKFIRSHWDVNRWGRGIEKPRFRAGVSVKEVPTAMLAGAK